ncbi:2OG-Fe(II) oxygenase family protein [Acidisoma cladoniae]|jgi:uncharacterized protein (TIGR02466 family)|uniref:2OG-Fe(II) oxygenase family protein n=1 Tax=Acidisoma cladoniae TaxID=3040935 RepID=UPI002550BC99|nr:2OG-Fe(II) oxygenase family protein [Acidisoma sp. PAMC 29798]
MARLEINVRGLFATPVAAVELPDAAARNAELSRLILQRRAETPSVQASNAGGWHSDRAITEWGGPRIAEVLTLARQVATQMTGDRQGHKISPVWTTQAWANVNGPGDGNISHYHPGSFWSGTYYVDDGGCASDSALGGEFEMIDPRGPGPGMYAPGLKFAGEDGASVGSGETIRPKPGLLFIFPSWLFHQVRPYRGTGLRISIAFNLGVSSGEGR